MICDTVDELTPIVGTRPACRALGRGAGDRVPAAYRRRRDQAARPRPTPARAMDASERARVLDVLHGDRFVDSSPAEVYATLLDEGTYLCSERTMYRLLAGAPRAGAGAARPAHPSRLRAAGAARDRAERAVELGHFEVEGPGEVDVRTTCT